MPGPWGDTAERRRRREIRRRRARVREARRSREHAERRRTEGLTYQEIRRRRRAVWRRVWGTGAVLVGAFTVLTAHEVWATRDDPAFDAALALAVLAAGLYGVGAGGVVVFRARRELPRSLAGWGLVTWFAVVLALPSYKYGDLIGGPVAVTGVWLAVVGASIRYLLRETGD
ncbi:hypothetical protein SAMN06272735_0564 [Streptomyces sp. TLI_55]|uniref:hypothetical protein n=1 Tax=Streptomyces sp. TLI_55 TaxID=1938861 RepID=UPI000BDC46C4|nr:hypothetical protein [Streptomyces sp. TLI_55]SNX56120.1 hypothetical protein SAMN06272735_0564 [Streptomyces sp. TLI_55]